MDRDALRLELRELFLDELDEHVLVLNRGLLALEQSDDRGASTDVVNEIFRAAHSLKGAAGAAGAPPVETICHRLEDVLGGLRDGTISSLGAFEPLFRAVDVIAEAGRQLREGTDISGLPVREVLQSLASVTGDGSEKAAAPSVTTDPPRLDHGPVMEARGDHRVRADASSVRVGAGRLEALLNQAGEVLLVGQRVHALAGDIHSTSAELAAGMAWREVGDRLDKMARAAAVADRLLSGLAQTLADDVRRARMLPFAHACEGLERVARDLAKAGGKNVQVEIAGGEVELDRPVLDALREPLLHLVRNAVDHGIEEPEARQRAGKPSAGHIRVGARLQGASVEVTVADDGTGVAVAELRTAVERRGADAGAEDDESLLDLAFMPAVSTSPIITEVSGRGIGLDAVRARVEGLGGSARLLSSPGVGARVVLVLPVSLSAIRVLLVAAGEEVLALPSSGVARLVRARAKDLQMVADQEMLLVDGRPVPVMRLTDVIGVEGKPEPREEIQAVLVGTPGSEALLRVDRLVGEEEVVMKPVGERLAGVAGVLGATILATGRVAVVVNPATCVRVGLERTVGGSGPPPDSQERRQKTRVLLAEDTLTTRALERSILESAGYEVLVAVDGAEAWDLLQKHEADVVVSDVNMPRMDGLALCQAVRASSRFRELPFVLVTSLATEEDRRRGVEAGADAYIVKSDFEQAALLDAIERLG